MKAALVVALIVAVAATPVASAVAQTPAGAPNFPGARTIEVSGQGETRAAPDLATLDLAVETHAPTAEQSASRNAELSQKVVDALKLKLGDKGKIWTGGYSLFPEYSERPGLEKPRVIGYRAENSIILETGALDLVGPLIDAAIGAGANRVNSLNFSLRNDAAARNEAIARASKDAQNQAQALAAATGLKLKRVLRASTVSEVRPIPVFAARTMAMGAANVPTPIQPNEIRVPATVLLVYEIE